MRTLNPLLRTLRIPLAAVMLCACEGGTEPEPPPEPVMAVELTGAIADSLRGIPRISRYGFVIDAYQFQIFAELTKGWYQYVMIWGEGPRPRVGTYPLTPWREGQAGRRMHAMFSRDVPGGAASYQAVSGELRITVSTPRVVAGEFTFHGVPGYLMPDRAVLSPQLAATDVRGTFTARCDDSAVCP